MCAAVLLCSLAFGSPVDAAAKHQSTTAKKKAAPSATAHARTTSKSAKSTKASTRSASHKGKRSRKGSRKGQQRIDAERTHQIQEALVRQHYLSGQPTGNWDAATEEALRRFQADNGWQNKTVPDSRALIKLGLGPNHDHLLNPESAMTTTPEAPSRAPASVLAPTPSEPSVPAGQPQR